MNEFMLKTYKEALKAKKKKEIPVGAIIVKDNKIIAKAHNIRQKKHNILGHAEIVAILKAEKKLKDWRLDNCVMFVTLEPCEMCEKIIQECRLKKVFYLVKTNKKEHMFEQTNDCKELKQKYTKILKSFFKELREKN